MCITKIDTRNIEFCEECGENREFIVEQIPHTSKREDGLEYSFVYVLALCTKCGEEIFVPAIYDTNVMVGHSSLKKALAARTESENR